MKILGENFTWIIGSLIELGSMENDAYLPQCM